MPHVYLHGDLSRFGGPYDFAVDSPAEAVRALCSQIKGLRQRLSEGAFRVIRKAASIERNVRLEMLGMHLEKEHELHIVPVVAGSKGGVGKVILGVALVAAAIAFAPAGAGLLGADLSASAFTVLGASISYGQIAGFGAVLLLGGVSQLLSPSPKGSTGGTTAATNPSFIFSGPVNVTEQGHAVPLVYGRFFASSVVISSDLKAENI